MVYDYRHGVLPTSYVVAGTTDALCVVPHIVLFAGIVRGYRVSVVVSGML